VLLHISVALDHVAKVLFSITDAQLRGLHALQRGGEQLAGIDRRTLTGLRRRQLIQGAEAGRDVLTPAGEAAVTLCERLAIPAGTPKGRRGS
jgi:hypothetical protein